MVAAVDKAVKLVSEILEANRISCTNDVIENEVQSWYSNSDISNEEMLAAAVLEWGYWRQVSYSDWCDARAKWFCDVPEQYSNFSVGEIEAAQRDLMWQVDMV